MRKLKFFTLLAFVFILSCDNDIAEDTALGIPSVETSIGAPNLESVPLEEARAFFKDLKKTGKIGKSSGLEIDLESIRQEELSDNTTQIIVLDATTNLEIQESKVFQLKVNGKIETRIAHVYEHTDGTSKGPLQKSIVVSDLNDVVYGNLNLNNGNYYSSDPCPYQTINCNQFNLNEVVVYGPPRTDTPTAGPSFTSPWVTWSGYNNYLNTAHLFGVGIRYQAVRDFDDKIRANELDPCVEEVYEDLVKALGGFGASLDKFINLYDEFVWELSMGDLKQNQYGVTTQAQSINGERVIKTKFSSENFINSSDLAIAQIIIHESYHAYLEVILKGRVGPNEDLVDVLEIYKSHVSLNAAQHQAIVELYLSELTSQLQAYGQSQGYRLGDDFYEAMAWGGLMDHAEYDSDGNFLGSSETEWFKKLVPNKDDRDDIREIIQKEIIKQDRYGDPATQKGKETDCE